MSTIVVDHRLTESATTAVECRTTLAFEDFYTANEGRLFRALFVLTGDRHESEDLMQTAFCKVLERWERVAQLDDPVGYLFRTAFNTHHSATRRAVRAARRLVDRSSDRPPPLEPSELTEVRDRATRALDVLTPRQREAVVLTELLGFGRPEAARIMGIRPATVRVLVSQARTALVGARGEEA